MLKVIIAGYGEMLAALAKGVMASKNEVVGVIRDERVKLHPFVLFLKDMLCPSRDYSFIKSYNFHEIKARSVNGLKFRDEVRRLNADIVLVGSWSEKFCYETIIVPSIATINTHPSLLPKHRGANPYFWALYNGEDKTGVTFHLMDEKYDAGDILYQSSVKIDETLDCYTLKIKCCKVAELMLKELLTDIAREKIIPIKQNEFEASYECQITEKNVILDFNRTIFELKNHIRALMPYFYPHFRAMGRLYEAKKWNFVQDNSFLEHFEPSDIIDKQKGKFIIKCGDGAIELEV